MAKLSKINTYDLRFPTSENLDGSDAMNPDPDYSAAYLILKSDDNLCGNGFAFTIGRGNDLCCKAIEALAPNILGVELDWIKNNPAKFWRLVCSDTQLRWVGPEKGIIHMASSAIINAVWDLIAKKEGKPIWKLFADMKSEDLANIIDYRHLTDVLNKQEAIQILKQIESTKNNRIKNLNKEGYPSYVTSAGWLGYTDEKIKKLCIAASKKGFQHVKLKVGRNLKDDIRRISVVRETLGDEVKILLDANQVWEVDEAISWMRELSHFKPYFIEEPTSPDDIFGHKKIKDAIYPIKVATGEAVQNRIIFKQLIANGAIDIVQIDACRMGGVNEALAVQLIAKKYNLPVWPHAGGVGLCEYVQHLAMIDYICISGEKSENVIEYVDHLHEHFINPVKLINANYMPPSYPGFSIDLKPEVFKNYIFKN